MQCKSKYGKVIVIYLNSALIDIRKLLFKYNMLDCKQGGIVECHAMNSILLCLQRQTCLFPCEITCQADNGSRKSQWHFS